MNIFEKPLDKEISDEDWNAYIHVCVFSNFNVPVGSKLFEAYNRVNDILKKPIPKIFKRDKNGKH